MELDKQIYTAPEVACIWRIKEPTVRAWILNNRIPVVRMGRRVFIKREFVQQVLNEGLDPIK